jgi:imidazoleglycerol phosphate synthase glutamine amidotransferase subunit HisH
MGNLLSVSKAFEHVAPLADIVVTADPAVIAAAAPGGVSRCRRDAGLHA